MVEHRPSKQRGWAKFVCFDLSARCCGSLFISTGGAPTRWCRISQIDPVLADAGLPIKWSSGESCDPELAGREALAHLLEGATPKERRLMSEDEAQAVLACLNEEEEEQQQ